MVRATPLLLQNRLQGVLWAVQAVSADVIDSEGAGGSCHPSPATGRVLFVSWSSIVCGCVVLSWFDI